jgi:hypothetical protein
MSDPTTSLRDRTSVLAAALAQWAEPATAPDEAAIRRAAVNLIDAIDGLLRDLYLLRGSLVQQIRHTDGRAHPRVA